MDEQNGTGLNNSPIYHQFLFQSGFFSYLMNELTYQEYALLDRIEKVSEENAYADRRVYLKELAAQVNLSGRSLSCLVKCLKEKGYVLWKHDGNGSEGTYLIMTDLGRDTLYKNKTMLKQRFAKVITEFGENRMLSLISLWKDLEGVMNGYLTEDCA